MVYFNNMNMLNMNDTLTSGSFGGGNVLSSLFCGTNSIFNSCGNLGGGYYNYGGGYNLFGAGNLFTNCYGQFNYGAMAGLAIGNTLLNIGAMLAGGAIQNKRENSTQALDAKADEIYDALKKEQTELEREEEALDKLKDNYSYLEKDVKNAETLYKNTKEYIENNKSAYETAKAKTDSEKTEKDKTLISDYEAKQKELEKHAIAYSEAQEKLKIEASKIEEKEIYIEATKETIDDIKAKLKDVEDAIDESILDKADGTIIQRTREEDFNTLFNDKNELSSTSVKKADVRFAILGYRNAKTEKEREAWKNKFEKLYNALSTEDQDNRDLSAAYSIICG